MEMESLEKMGIFVGIILLHIYVKQRKALGGRNAARIIANSPLHLLAWYLSILRITDRSSVNKTSAFQLCANNKLGEAASTVPTIDC